MKLQDLKVGDAVILGSPRDVNEGHSGQLAHVVAIGKYTEARTACGRVAVPFAKGSQRAVLAVSRAYVYPGNRRFRASTQESQGEWEPMVVGAGSIRMTLAEYKVKNSFVVKQQRELERWQVARQKNADGVRSALLRAVGASVPKKHDPYRTPLYISSRWDQKKGEHVPSVELRLSTDELRKVIGAKEFDAIIGKLAEFENDNPRPDECSL